MSKPLRFLRLPDVEQRVGLRHTRIRELEREGKFPQRVLIGDRANGWVESEIEAWMEQRVANRVAVRQSIADTCPQRSGDVPAFVAASDLVGVSPLGSMSKVPTPGVSPYLRMGEVMRLTGMNHEMIYDGVRAKSFPKWAGRGVGSGWRRTDVETWLSAREARATA
jgi:prophage regulatory protein